MDTWFLGARHSLRLAVATNPSLVAVAAKGTGSVVQLNVLAGRSIHARVLLAVRDGNLAVGACESGFALACVRSLACVEAGASVLAGLVVGAVVQVLVAEQTTPALVALALPRLFAGSVHASWVSFAFCAQSSLPSGVASVGENRRKGEKLVSDLIK